VKEKYEGRKNNFDVNCYNLFNTTFREIDIWKKVKDSNPKGLLWTGIISMVLNTRENMMEGVIL